MRVEHLLAAAAIALAAVAVTTGWGLGVAGAVLLFVVAIDMHEKRQARRARRHANRRKGWIDGR